MEARGARAASGTSATLAASPAEEALAAVARRAGLAFFRVDANRDVVEMSPALERLTGFDAADIVGRSCLLVHRCVECLAGCGVFREGEVTDKALELHHADGSIVRVRKSGRAFRDATGSVVGALEIVEPIGAADSGDDAIDLAPEARRIRDALRASRYRRVEAARKLGMSRTTLWRKMKEHGLLDDEPSTRTEQ